MNQASWNPYFRKLWERASAKPDAIEDHPWGETVFKVRGKVFIFLGRPDSDARASVTVKSAPGEVEELLTRPYAHRAHYIGRYDWVNVAVESEDVLQLALDLVDASYERIVGKKRRGSATAKLSSRTTGEKEPPDPNAVRAPAARKRTGGAPRVSAAKKSGATSAEAPAVNKAAARKTAPRKTAPRKRGSSG